MKAKGWFGAAMAAGLLAAYPARAADSDDTTEAMEASDEDVSSATSEAMFDFLVSELAAQRGDVDSAITMQEHMARELHDAAIARRAVELAIRNRAFTH